MMVVYEIHTFRDGAWKIDSVFDDRDLAVLEAQRVERTNRYSGVRVVEETYDQATDRTVTRTIYRSSKVDRPNAEALQRRIRPAVASSSAIGSASASGTARSRPARPAAMAKRPASLTRVILVATLTIGAILFCSLGALYALNTLTR